jgi:hypothetical protein
LKRAVAAGDLAAIRALLEQAPEKAAAALLQAAATAGVDHDCPTFVELALAISARLRRAYRFDLALRVVQTVGATTQRLRVERALAALGAGNDALVGELVASDPDVATLLEPYLAAVTGRAIPKAHSSASPLLRGIHAISRAALAIANKKPAQVRTSIAAVSANHAHALRTTVWKHLSTFLSTPWQATAIGAVGTLLVLEPFRSHPPQQAALGWELGRRFPSALVDGSTEKGFAPDSELSRSAQLAATSGLQDPVARLRQFLAHSGLSQVPEPERAAAALYQGYFLLTSEPKKALGAFDRSLALGADLLETLRGRWLASRGTDPSVPSSTESELSAGERLAHVLERQPDSEPLRAVLSGQLGAVQLHAGKLDALRQTLETLHRLVEQQGYDDETLLADLRLLELSALAHDSPEKALERIEALLTDTNRDRRLWSMAIALMNRAGREADADAVTCRAAALGIAPEFSERAKSAHRRRCLSNVSPKDVTPGVLANELRIRLERFGDAPGEKDTRHVLEGKDILEARSRLAPRARTAVDAAALALVSRYSLGPAFLRLAMEYLVAASREERHPTWILAVALLGVDREPLLVQLVKEVARSPVPASLLEVAVSWIALGIQGRTARKCLLAVVSKMDAAAAKRVQRVIDRGTPAPEHGDPNAVMAELGKVLAPEFELLAWLRGEEGEDDFDDDFDDDDLALERRRVPEGRPSPDETRKLLIAMGLPKKKVLVLPPARLAQMADVLVSMLGEPPSARSAERLLLALMNVGFSSDELYRLASNPNRFGKKRGFDTCPF